MSSPATTSPPHKKQKTLGDGIDDEIQDSEEGSDSSSTLSEADKWDIVTDHVINVDLNFAGEAIEKLQRFRDVLPASTDHVFVVHYGVVHDDPSNIPEDIAMHVASVNRTLDGTLESAIRILQLEEVTPPLLSWRNRMPEKDDKLRAQQYVVAFMQEADLRWDGLRVVLNFVPDPTPPRQALECVVDIERVRVGK